MAEWSKALRSGRSPLLWAGVQISLLTKFCSHDPDLKHCMFFFISREFTIGALSIEHQARLAQSVEHETLNLRVVGSSPTLGALLMATKH